MNRQQIIQRKEKVASYSKLVREIHWDSKNSKRKESQDFINHKKILKRDSNMTFEQRAESNHIRSDRANEYKHRHAKEHKSVIEGNEMKENFDFNIKSNIKTSKNKDLHNESKNIYNLKRNIENAINKQHISLEENEKNQSNIEQRNQDHQIMKINQKNQKQFRFQEPKIPNKSIRDIRDSPNTMIKPFELEDNINNIEDYTNILDVLNVSGIDKEDAKEFRVGRNNNEYIKNGVVNDQIINDIQRRLELLDEFK